MNQSTTDLDQQFFIRLKTPLNRRDLAHAGFGNAADMTDAEMEAICADVASSLQGLVYEELMTMAALEE